MPDAPVKKLHAHPREGMARIGGGAGGRAPAPVGYAELQVMSNFSFLRGASHPDELVARAGELGHRAVALTDVNTLAGIVRAHVAAGDAGVRLVVGARLALRSFIQSMLPLRVGCSLQALQKMAARRKWRTEVSA